MRVFFSVGEPSGDQHAAHLIAEMRRQRPDLEAYGFGGPQMERAGFRLSYPLTNLAVMGIAQVIPLLWRFYSLVKQAERMFDESPPDAVVVVDFPGFNFHIARVAKKRGIPVFFYLPPQMWAWGPWRVRKMRKHVDHVLCGLPFEPDWYAARGLEAEYVGHPFFDEVADHELNEEFLSDQRSREGRVIGILPGSRNREVHRNWSMLCDMMLRIHDAHPDTRFVVGNFKASQRTMCLERLDDAARRLPIEFHVDRTSEVIELAECCLMVSGSISLELLARETPACVIYNAGTLLYGLGWLLRRCDYMTLTNLIAGRELMPERPSPWHSNVLCERFANSVVEWLDDPEAMASMVSELRRLKQDVVRTGATVRTAEAILERLPPASLERAA